MMERAEPRGHLNALEPQCVVAEDESGKQGQLGQRRSDGRQYLQGCVPEAKKGSEHQAKERKETETTGQQLE